VLLWKCHKLSVMQQAVMLLWKRLICHNIYIYTHTHIYIYICVCVYNKLSSYLGHVKLVHCHQGMTRPQVADRGDGLQIWRVAANILNEQSWTADSGWSSSLGVGRELTSFPRKNQYLLRNTTQSFGPRQIIWRYYVSWKFQGKINI
jgi:hypothetical protein